MADIEKDLPIPAMKDEIAIKIDEKEVKTKVKETNGDGKDKKSGQEEVVNDAKMGNYIRILKYGTRLDFTLLGMW